MREKGRPAQRVGRETEHELRRRGHSTEMPMVDRTADPLRAEEGGEEPRVEGAGRRNEVADHEAHGLTDRPPALEASHGVAEQGGPGEERLDDER